MTDAPLSLVVFDVDGTLVDSQNHIVVALEAAFAEGGIALPDRATLLSVVGLSLPIAIARLAPEAPEPVLDRMVASYKQTFGALRATGEGGLSPLYPGAREVLDMLAAEPRTLLGVATGKSRRGLDHVLAAHALDGRFLTLQTADLHPSKPHPAMLQAALAETGCDAAGATMIGDTVFDIEMGRAAGFATIGVSWGYHPAEALRDAGATRVIDSFSDLPAALAELREVAA